MLEVMGVEEAVPGHVSGTQSERAGGQAEREGGAQAEAAGAEGPHARQHRPQHEQSADHEQRDRRQVARPAEQEEDPVGHRLAHLSPGPAQVEDGREIDRQGDEAQADDVEVVLLEGWKPHVWQKPARPPAAAACAPAACHGSPLLLSGS